MPHGPRVMSSSKRPLSTTLHPRVRPVKPTGAPGQTHMNPPLGKIINHSMTRICPCTKGVHVPKPSMHPLGGPLIM